MTLLEAVTAGDHKAVREILDQGTFADEGGTDGMTPLMVAASRGDEGMVRLLLYYGADAGLRDRVDETALLKAAANGHGSVFNVLAPLARPDDVDLARAFLRNAGIDPATLPAGPPREEVPSKTDRALATAAARVSSFFGNEDPEKRLARAERAEGRGPKKR